MQNIERPLKTEKKVQDNNPDEKWAKHMKNAQWDLTLVNCKLKQQRDSTIHILEWLQSKVLTSNVVVHEDCSFVAGRTAKIIWLWILSWSPKEILYSLAVNPYPLILSQLWATTNLLSVAIDMPVLDVECMKWDIAFVSNRFSLTVFWRLTHPESSMVACTCKISS